jgi:8-oxo-dGTP diphosphatase
MGFEDRFRFSVHAVIPNAAGRVLLLRQTYGDRRWGLPGGSVEPGETITKAIARECREEIGVDVALGPLTGWYFHSAVQAQVGIFRCNLPDDAEIVLSDEHDEFRWEAPQNLLGSQAVRVTAALSYSGQLHTRAF